MPRRSAPSLDNLLSQPEVQKAISHITPGLLARRAFQQIHMALHRTNGSLRNECHNGFGATGINSTLYTY